MSNPDKRLTGWKLQQMRAQKIRENPLCLHCLQKGITRLGDELDHIVPVSKGGGNEESNLQLLCSECHATKTISDLGYKPKPIIGIDGWPQTDEKFVAGGGIEKSKAQTYKTGMSTTFKKTSGKKA